MGNSIVRQSISQPEPRFTGTIDTSKLDAKLAQQFGSDFNTATDNQISQIAEQTATDLSKTVSVPETSFVDVDTFASSAAGLSLATNFVTGAQQNEVAIRNLITTTNQNRAIAAEKRLQSNELRRQRLEQGAIFANEGNIGAGGLDIKQQFLDLNVAENAAISRQNLLAHNARQKENAIDFALGASLFIPGLGLVGGGVRLGIAGVRLLSQNTLRTSVVGGTSLFASQQLIENGINNIGDGVSLVSNGSGINTLDLSADTRVGVFGELVRNDTKIVETKLLTGTDVDPFAISFKSGFLEDKNLSELGVPLNSSVRFDFENGLGIPQTNLISEVDLGAGTGFNKLGEIKPVIRQNLTTGNTSFGSNTKLKVGPSFSFLSFDLNTGLAFESRNSLTPKNGN